VNSVVGSVQEELHLCREEDTEQQKMWQNNSLLKTRRSRIIYL
jgi:hypothetical protein